MPLDISGNPRARRLGRDVCRHHSGASCPLGLAPESSCVQHTLGMLRMFQCRWAESERAYERAVALDPTSAYSHMMYALEHSFCARHKEALEHSRAPLSSSLWTL